MVAWWFIGGGICAIFGLMVALWLCAYGGADTITDAQKDAVKEWLLYAVTEMEIRWGKGTGKIKLRNAYDKFVRRFPDVARLISFETFAVWVDAALVEMKGLLENNPEMKSLIDCWRAV